MGKSIHTDHSANMEMNVNTNPGHAPEGASPMSQNSTINDSEAQMTTDITNTTTEMDSNPNSGSTLEEVSPKSDSTVNGSEAQADDTTTETTKGKVKRNVTSKKERAQQAVFLKSFYEKFGNDFAQIRQAMNAHFAKEFTKDEIKDIHYRACEITKSWLELTFPASTKKFHVGESGGLSITENVFVDMKLTDVFSPKTEVEFVRQGDALLVKVVKAATPVPTPDTTTPAQEEQAGTTPIVQSQSEGPIASTAETAQVA